MTKAVSNVPIAKIIIDEEIYPRGRIAHKRVDLFADNLRDGFKFDPIEVQIHSEDEGKFRILDGAHRWHAHKESGATEIPVHIIVLDGIDPLLYAAQKAIGPLQLTEEEAKNTARRAYDNNPRLTSFEIGQAIGRSRRTVDRYIADLKATIHEDLGLNVFRLNLLGVPQERIAQRLQESRIAIRGYLADLVTWPKGPNADLKKGFSVAQVADRQQWPESLVWSFPSNAIEQTRGSDHQRDCEAS